MEYFFSDKIKNLKPSAIREIFKYAADPAVVSLSAGNPAPDAFPSKEIARICADIFATRPIDALQYSLTEGYPALRAHLKTYMREKYGVGRDFDEVLITTGAQQVMELAAKVLCNPDDVILCEDPSFVGSLNCFRSLGARLVGVPMQRDGLDVDQLEQKLKSEKNVRALYTIPNFQNPTGATMSAEKRRAVYELARRYNILIIEDNPYGDLRYRGEDVPGIKTLDEDGRVIYVGSFSKVISPGLRVGYTVCPDPILKKMVVAKQGEDVHTNILAQMICHVYMTEYDFEAHLDFLRSLYREKAALMVALVEQHLCPAGITYQDFEGGLFVWGTLPEGVDMPEFCTRAVRDHKVAVVPGSAFLPEEDGRSQSFRMNFSTPTDDALRAGLQRLGAFAKEYIGR